MNAPIHAIFQTKQPLTAAHFATQLRERPAFLALATRLAGHSDAPLPPLFETAAAVLSLTRGSRLKVLLPLPAHPLEYALVRDGNCMLVSCYSTESTPEVYLLDRPVGIDELSKAVAAAAMEVARDDTEPTKQQAAAQIASRLSRTAIVPVPTCATRQHTDADQAQKSTASTAKKAQAFAFNFSVTLKHTSLPALSRSACADIHALLFAGTLSASVRGRNITLVNGPVMPPVIQMLRAVRCLVDAKEAGKPTNIRLRAGDFCVGVRTEETQVFVSLGSESQGSFTAASLSHSEAATPILTLASALMQTLIKADRHQIRNLRVRSIRDEVRRLRKLIRQQKQPMGFVNTDPESLRTTTMEALGEPALGEPALGEPTDFASASASASTFMPTPEALSSLKPGAGAGPVAKNLRFGERWRIAVDGLDANATFLCGDRFILTTQEHTIALSRADGEVLWAREGLVQAMVAGKHLLRIAADGLVEICDISDGETHTETRIRPGAGHVDGLFFGGSSGPPIAILSEGPRSLVAIDLQTGQQRWRFSARSTDAFRLHRVGRILLVACSHGALHAVDVVTGEHVWHFSCRANRLYKPLVYRDTVFVVGEKDAKSGVVFGVDLYTGVLQYEETLPGRPVCDPVSSGSKAVFSTTPSSTFMHSSFLKPTLLTSASLHSEDLLGISMASGEIRWQREDPGLAMGAGVAVDETLFVNAPGGHMSAVSTQTGELRWQVALSDSTTDDVPRRLDPMLRGGALFVPAANVHVIRPSDGTFIGAALPCDLVPDLLKVDERSWIYIAEESGHIAAYAPVPHLTLVRGPGS